MTAYKASAFMGEGHTGMRRMTPISGDHFSFMDHALIELEPIGPAGKTRRTINPANQRFIRKIEADVKSGAFNPQEILKKLSGGRRKSPKAA